MADAAKTNMVIGNFLKQVKRQVKLEDTKNYKLLGVKWYGEGMFLREEKLGKDIKAEKLYQVHTGDFVYNRLFAWKSSFAIVDNDLDGCFVSNEFPTFEYEIEKVDPYFLLSYVLQPAYIDFVNRQSGGMSGISRKRLKEEVFIQSQFPDYTLDQQRRISANIKKRKGYVVDLATSFEGQSNLLSKLQQTILQEAVEGELTAEWRKTNPKLISGENHASKLIKKIRDKVLEPPITDEKKPFKLPDGWVWCRLGEISKIERGLSPEYCEVSDYKILNQKCVRWNRIDGVWAKPVLPAWFRNLDKSRLTRVNDILVNSTGEGTIGRSGIVTSDTEGIPFDTHVLRAAALAGIVPEFVMYFINSAHGQNQVSELKGAKTTKQTELGAGNLSSFVFPLAPAMEQQEIVDKVNILLTKRAGLEKQVIEGKKLTLALLQSVLKEAFHEDRADKDEAKTDEVMDRFYEDCEKANKVKLTRP